MGCKRKEGGREGGREGGKERGDRRTYLAAVQIAGTENVDYHGVRGAEMRADGVDG